MQHAIMESELPTEGYGRGMRQTRRSQRAKEADLNLTGLQKSPQPGSLDDSSTPHKPSSPAPESQTASDNPTTAATSLDDNAKSLDPALATQTLSNIFPPQSTQSDAMSQQPIPRIEEDEAQNSHHPYQPNVFDLAAGTYATPTQTQQASSHPTIKEERSERLPTKRADSSAQAPKRQRVSKPQKSRKKKSAGERAPTEAPSRRKRPATPEANVQRFMTEDELLQPHKLAIYHWEPRPKDFLNLSEEMKAVKARADAAAGEMDDAPELDDWHEFCGLESDLFPNLHLKTSIGLNFSSRARRAFRAGRSWASFELEELAIDSRAGARALEDPREREIALSSSLSNSLRLYVFQELKVRLCHEIWLQPYPEDGVAPMRDSAIGTAAVTPAASDATALEKAAQRLDALPDRLRTMLPGNSLPVRTQPELPGRDRELHQPGGPPIRATQANLRGLGVNGVDRYNGVHLDMATSEEEE
ncbi:hypothetical protein Q7P35_003256 [Cladosporium inversicolor]